MNVSIGDRWQGFVERVVKDGRYGSASEVVREGLRLVEEREAKLVALRARLDASIALGGEVTEDELDAAITAKSAELRRGRHGAQGDLSRLRPR
jgi:antitoxin ParD1/3/4